MLILTLCWCTVKWYHGVIMDLYVIFFNPSDFPGKYVARRQSVGPGGKITKDPRPFMVGTLELVRAALPPELTRLNRDPNDDPCIFEVWV